jgi:hypothetical protein
MLNMLYGYTITNLCYMHLGAERMYAESSCLGVSSVFDT